MRTLTFAWSGGHIFSLEFRSNYALRRFNTGKGLLQMPCPVLLCIDDRSEILRVRKLNLEPLGYSVVTATNAITAIAILEQMHVTAVLMQYKGEGIDAEAVAYHIKQRFPHQPILLLSGYVEMPERVLWLVDDYIATSEYPGHLREAIERVTERKRQGQVPSVRHGEAA